jgi:negative regulator of flagellin synthesis FlgM
VRVDPNSIYQAGLQQPDQVGSSRANNTGKSSSSSRASSSDSGATVQLSSTHTTLQAAKAALADTPDVRADRVAELRSQLQSGQYNPSNDEIAGAMMSQLFGNS